MRIICISDTHERNIKNIPDGDVLIHAGDFFIGGNTLLALRNLNEDFKELPHKYKILVPGNHDWCFEDSEEEEARKIFTEGVVLINEEVTIDGVKFYGTPYQPIFYDWAFNKSDAELHNIYSSIPSDTGVLITHTPPYGILDTVVRTPGLHVGSIELIKKIKNIQKLQLHIFGHIHESYGVDKINNTTFVNASYCDVSYRGNNFPVVVDI